MLFCFGFLVWFFSFGFLINIAQGYLRESAKDVPARRQESTRAGTSLSNSGSAGVGSTKEESRCQSAL